MNGLPFLELFNQPLILFIIALLALFISIITLVTLMIISGRLSKLSKVEVVETEAPKPKPSKPSTFSSFKTEIKENEAPVPELKKMESKPPEIKPREGGLGFESIEELAITLGFDSLFFFNLQGMAIEAYKIKDEAQVAAALAEFVTALRRLGFPTETVTLKNGVQAMIVLVGKVGEMEVYALAVGKPDIEFNVDEIKQLLNLYISDIIKGGEA